MMKSVLSSAWVAGVIFAAPSAMAEVKGLGDIVHIEIRDDGRFNVECKDGSKEVVTFDDLLRDKVCNGGSDDEEDEEDEEEEEDDRPTDVEVKQVTISGSGCPNDSENVTYKVVKKNGAIRALELDYRSLEASTSGKRRVFCNAAFDIKHGAGYQYGFDPITVKGSAEVADGAKATHSMEIGFRQGSDQKMKIKKDIKGPFSGSYEAKASGETLWSPCGRTFPVNVKATLMARGKDTSIAMKGYKLRLPLRWKKCN